jgi:ABC-2 type transport system permease protein
MNTTIYWKETKYEFLKLFRNRRYTISVLGMPLMFYCFFALAMPSSAAFHLPTYLIATYGTFGVMSACLFGVGANLAHERSLGWLEMKRVSPLRGGVHLFSKIAANLIFCLAVEVLLLFTGVLFGHVQLSVWNAVKIVSVLLIGAIPFAALGVALGYWIKANSAPAVLNMINLPMAFCSGLWVPMMFLPPFLQKAAQFLPAYHLSKLALDVIGLDSAPAAGMHWLAMVAFTLVFVGLAVWSFGRQGDAAEAR